MGLDEMTPYCICTAFVRTGRCKHLPYASDKNIVRFLSESNAIEGVFDDESLAQAIRAWATLISKEVLTIEDVRQVHKILMWGHLKPRYRGTIRKVPVYIGSKQLMDPKKILKFLGEWLVRVNQTHSSPKHTHIEYEAIHPFIDGNGRTGRMFLNWQRLRQGLPILIIGSTEPEKQEYYRWFSENAFT